MKPRWYFILGSLGVFVGLMGIAIVSTFLVSLIAFSLRAHGPMGDQRFQQLLQGFPWWALGVALGGIVSGVFLLKKFDFSYKKNFPIIILIFIGSILIAGFAIDYLGLDSLWSRGRVMRGLYQQYDRSLQRRGQGNMQFFNNFER